MKKMRETQITLGTALALCLMACAAGIACCYAAFGWRTQAVQNKLREIDAIAAEHYVGAFDAETVADYAAVGYITGLGDQWSGYIPADQYESYQMNTEGKGCGIGVSVVTSGQGIRISLVYDASPAQQVGIRKGDWIVGAEGLTVKADGADAVIGAIQGEEGTEVTVTVRSGEDGRTRDETMTRAVVVQKMAWGEMLADRIGYIRIENFHVGAAEQFQNALDELIADGARALVLDVRHNGGGRVKEMSEMLDPLLPEGTIMTLRTKDGHETVYSSDAEMTDLPVAVLVDEQSISAAEFFAAALQEYGRGPLVGAHTTGKGRAQQTFRLSDGSAVNLSVEQYYTPEGNSLAGVGVAPDVSVGLTEAQQADFYFLMPENDPQLQKACELLT